jgi:4-diphosphocytidyl-2-C-methyl-D-erythritol kinase
MEKVDLTDEIRIRRTGRQGVRILGMDIPAPGNTVFRAAAALEQEAGLTLDIEVSLEKRIPVAAGLAGGSSDAAAVMQLLDKMYSLEVPQVRMSELALEIGADVPFFLRPGAMLAEGVGELLSRPLQLPDWHGVLVKPDTGLATADVYELYDSVAGERAAALTERRSEMLERLNTLGTGPEALAQVLVNDLEQPAISLCAEISTIKQQLLSEGALGALMSGSGPSVFGLFESRAAAEAARRQLAASHENVWPIRPFRQ